MSALMSCSRPDALISAARILAVFCCVGVFEAGEKRLAAAELAAFKALSD